MALFFYGTFLALFVLAISIVTALIDRFCPDAVDRLAERIFR